MRRIAHQTVRKVTEEMESGFGFNTAISANMEMVNALYKYTDEVGEAASLPLLRECFEFLALSLAPFVPHVAEELWEALGNGESIFLATWPKWDEEATKAEEITIVVQINGKVRDRLVVPADSDQEEIKEQALESERIQEMILGKEIVKTIVVPKKLVNIVVK